MPKKRKQKPMPFSREFFQDENNKWKFNPSFLAKQPVDRSRLLAKYYRKLGHTRRVLSNINRWVNRQMDKATPLKDASEREKQIFWGKISGEKERAISIAKSLFKDAANIFSEEYAMAILSSKFAVLIQQEKLHECHKFLSRIDVICGDIKKELFS